MNKQIYLIPDNWYERYLNRLSSSTWNYKSNEDWFDELCDYGYIISCKHHEFYDSYKDVNNDEYNQNNESVNLRIVFNIRIEIDNVNDANITMKIDENRVS